jgi:GNAT superfamily N-acetyltransferase
MALQLESLPLQIPAIRRFLRVPYRIYRDNPHWVAPLLADLEKVFQPVNPFFAHAEMQLWVVRRNGEDVGRIAAIIDRLHVETHQDPAAFFGFFECDRDPEASRMLFAAAHGWARQRGMRRAMGPMSPSTNDECGLLVKGLDSPPTLMMPFNPAYYAELIEAEGYQKARDLLAYYLNIPKAPVDRLDRIAAKVRRRHPEVTFRCLRKKTLAADLAKVKEVYNAAWEANWGFVPMTDAELDFMAERLKPLLCEEFTWLAETREEAVGFLLAVPDYNEAFKPLAGRLFTPRILGALPYLLGWKTPRMCRVITLGVKAKFRGKGIESVLLFEGFKTGLKLGMEGAEGSWILEDNTMMCRMMETFGGTAYKTYRIYSKELSS